MGESGERRTGEMGHAQNGGAVKLLLGRISCVVGILLAIGGTVSSLPAGSTTVSAGALGIALGVLGHFLGARLLATITVVLCTLVLLLGIAASQDLVQLPALGLIAR